MARKGSKRAERKRPAVLPVKQRDGSAGASVSGDQAASDRWRPWLVAGAVGLLVARPLYPSETPADTGDGLPLVMLWLALAVVWMLGLLGRRRFPVRFGLLDGLVVFLVGWHVGSALLGASRSHARPAVNMLWEWVGLGLVFVLVRQWAAGRREIRAIVAVMLALAVGLAGYGLFQCVYEFPRTRAAYQTDPEKALREAGFYYAPGSPERIAFEKRLESKEPIATFALTNSLAGFLTAWLVAAVGIGLLGGAWSAGWRPRLGLLVGCLLLGACLLLTKSRSAYLAVLAALGSLGVWWLWVQRAYFRYLRGPTVLEEHAIKNTSLSEVLAEPSCPPQAEPKGQSPYSPLPTAGEGGLQSRPGEGEGTAGNDLGSTNYRLPARSPAQPMRPARPHSQQWRRIALGAIGLLILLSLMIAAAWYWGGLDIQVLTEAKKSLQYRFEYWQATWQIIRQEPVWGCGPGLFRYAYTRFKLPQASEEIADPHNFLLEIWATAGTPAALAMLVFLLLWVIQVGRISRAGTPMGQFSGTGVLTHVSPVQGSISPSGLVSPDSPGKVLLGAVAGVGVGFWVGQWSAAPPSLYALIVGLPLGVAILWALWPWVQTSAGPTADGGQVSDRTAKAGQKTQTDFAGRPSASSPPQPNPFPQKGEGTGPPQPNPLPQRGEGIGSHQPNPLPQRGEGIGGSPEVDGSSAQAHASFSPPHPGFGQTEVFPGVLAVAAGALLVNLLAVGGISFAGVAGSFWLLAALATITPGRPEGSAPCTANLSAFSETVPPGPVKNFPAVSDSSVGEPPHTWRQKLRDQGNWHWLAWLDLQHQVGWPGAIGGVVLTMAVFFACHQTAFRPVLERQTFMYQAVRLAGRDGQQAEKLFQQAASADPFSAQPAEWLAALAFQQWQERFQKRPKEPAHWTARLQQFEQYALLALELNPEDAPAWFIQGQRFLEIGSLLLAQSPREARRAFYRALGCLQQAASLYPNNALYRARLAETFAALGYQPGIRREAQAALWLDSQMPHAEKKLPEPLRRQLTQMQARLD